MALHADQAIVIPEPWLQPWAINIIWCLDDVHEANGATRYLPGSHRITTLAEVPEDAVERMQPFEAPAGAIVARTAAPRNKCLRLEQDISPLRFAFQGPASRAHALTPFGDLPRISCTYARSEKKQRQRDNSL